MNCLVGSEYLPVDSAPFDLIVFDEASQIPVWDAIGVIARGKQLIVVGGKDSEAFFTTELKHHPELNYAFTTTEGDFGAAVVSLL